MKGPVRHMADLKLLPREGTFLFRDHFPVVVGGVVRYWENRGLVRRVGYAYQDGSKRCGIWELTERARRLLG